MYTPMHINTENKKAENINTVLDKMCGRSKLSIVNQILIGVFLVSVLANSCKLISYDPIRIGFSLLFSLFIPVLFFIFSKEILGIIGNIEYKIASILLLVFGLLSVIFLTVLGLL